MNKLLSFKEMHQQDGLLFLPNAWDLLSALVLEQSGFKAIGTTSWGVANAMGYKDGENIEFDVLLALAKKMVLTVDIPVTVDIESGYSEDINLVADNALRVAEIGAVGINFEDSLKNNSGLIDVAIQCDFLEKIRSRLDNNGFADFFINARIDTYFQLENPLSETMSRARKYFISGANGIFVPGLNNSDEIEQVVGSTEAPLNVMSLASLTDVDSLNKLGVKRFSIGNALSDATTAFIEQKSSQILTQQNTASLYESCEVKTVFR